MSTTLAKPGTVERKWYIIDAAGKPLGRTAATAAVLLRGKNKVTFTPNVDCGDHVIIINCDQAVLTGSKLDKKYYYHHSGWIGGMKAVQYRTLMAEKSDKAMMLAVKGMLPGNTLGAAALKRLRVYKGLRAPETLFTNAGDGAGLDVITQGFGVANYYRMNGQEEKGVEMLKKVVYTAEHSKWYAAFGCLAARVDLKNIGQA